MGVRVQLQVRDLPHQQQQWRAGLQALAEAGTLPSPAAAAVADGGSAAAATASDVAAFDFICVAVPQEGGAGLEGGCNHYLEGVSREWWEGSGCVA